MFWVSLYLKTINTHMHQICLIYVVYKVKTSIHTAEKNMRQTKDHLLILTVHIFVMSFYNGASFLSKEQKYHQYRNFAEERKSILAF